MLITIEHNWHTILPCQFRYKLENAIVGIGYAMMKRLVNKFKRKVPSLSFFEPKVNRLRYETIAASGLFDEDYYLTTIKSVSPYRDAIAHYVGAGWKMGLSPSPDFSTQYYLYCNNDVKRTEIEPLFHYIMFGEDEGRSPNPYFDPKSYLEKNPDIAAFNKTLLLHYVVYGRDEGRDCTGRHSSNTLGATTDLYQQWITKNENLEFRTVKSDLDSFTLRPKISIVVPVYDPDERFLIECIESVIAQTYENWELCLADDNSTKDYVRKVMTDYAAKDHRIKTVFREEHGHISAASNSALGIATGEWIALLDNDDRLHPHALYHVVKAIDEKPETELVYSDEDKLDQHGHRTEPHFKSDWNLDLLYSQNYVSHLGVYRSDLVRKIGGFRLGVEGSQDYDLLLRYSREIDHTNVVHIPRVLYHWRMVGGSTAFATDGKSYTTDAGIKALKDHFEALKQDVTVEQGKHLNTYKVNWVVQGEPLVSLIIPTHNGREITKQAIDSILDKTTYRNFEILLVDNNSDDPSMLAYFDEIGQHKQVTVLRYPYPFNFSAINNFAVQHASGEIVGLINNDVEVITPEWLTEAISHAQRDDVGCVGAMLYYPDETIQHAGIIVGLGGVAGHSHKHFLRGNNGYFYRLKLVQNFSAVTAACLWVRKEVFNAVGGLNEKDLTVAFNDVDFCLKVQAAGYRNVWTPYAELYHHESISRGAEDTPEKIARFEKEIDYMKETWGTHIKRDPHYSQNLTLTTEDFAINV